MSYYIVFYFYSEYFMDSVFYLSNLLLMWIPVFCIPWPIITQK